MENATSGCMCAPSGGLGPAARGSQGCGEHPWASREAPERWERAAPPEGAQPPGRLPRGLGPGKGFPGGAASTPLPGGSPGKVGTKGQRPPPEGAQPPVACKRTSGASALRQGVPRGAASTPGLPGGSPERWELKGNARVPRRARGTKMQPPVACKRTSGASAPGKGFPGVRRAPLPAGRLPGKVGIQRQRPWFPEGALTENATSGCM